MIFAEGLFALVIAFFLTIMFVVLGRCARSWPAIVVFFVLVFCGAWAGGVWIAPVGPRIMGVYWLSFLSAGIVFALLQAALRVGHPSASCARDGNVVAQKERELSGLFNIFLFILLVIFIAVIVIGYVHRLR
jgi:hypothetical protein